MQNKGGQQSFDPFMFSLMTEQSQVKCNSNEFAIVPEHLNII